MLSKKEIKQWKEKSFVLVKNIIDKKILKQCINFMDKQHANKDFGSKGKLEFPSGKVIDYITLSKNIINCV